MASPATGLTLTGKLGTAIQGHELQETVGFWAGYLVFVKWNKIQALFSLRYSKDKASGKS